MKSGAKAKDSALFRNSAVAVGTIIADRPTRLGAYRYT
jgi:hypothetical protein